MRLFALLTIMAKNEIIAAMVILESLQLISKFEASDFTSHLIEPEIVDFLEDNLLEFFQWVIVLLN